MKIFLFLLLGAHSIISLFSLRETGVMGAFPPFQELFVYQIFSDLVVSLILVLVFIYFEIRKKKKPLIPFVLCCAGVGLMGSFSVLIYLFLNSDLFSFKKG